LHYVATLIASPDGPALPQPLVREVASRLPGGRLSIWLEPERAADISFALTDLDPPDVAPQGETAFLASFAQEIARRFFAGHAVDVVMQPADARRKRLFLADMDSTMIGQECIDELADKAGLKDKVAAITERAMRGEIAFEPALRERVALLRGLPIGAIQEVLVERIRLTPGARTLVRTMRSRGAYTCLVSGGFTHFTGPVAAMIGFDEHRANRLVVEDGRLTGEVEEPILGREAKLEALSDLRRRLQLASADTLAVGDGANDLAMLGEAGLGVAYRAKPAVAAAAHARLEHADLTGLLFAQGYRRTEFVEG
jgi:phosphoserine phosphatase